MDLINCIKSAGFEPIGDAAKTRMPVTASDITPAWTLKPGSGELELVELERAGGLREWQLWRRIDKADPAKPNPLDPAEPKG